MRTELRVAPAIAAGWIAFGLQYGRFLVVGAVATLVHILLYVAAVAMLDWSPLAANALGFAVGVQISYFGHGRWTFRDSAGSPLRFCGVAVLGFLINSLFVQLITVGFGLAYGWAIPFIAGVTPVLTFALSKFWAFRL